MTWQRVSWFAGKGRQIVFAGPPSHCTTIPRHPRTGRFLAFDCEIDCQQHCAGLCQPYDWAVEVEDDPTPPHGTERP
jgi:hypothetical protein